jgi:holin-like protein
MLEYLLILFTCQFLGELARALTGAPLSGPVIGMALLFFGLVVLRTVPAGLQQVSSGILQHLSLLFVPAAVGVTLHLSVIREEWLAISAALIGSTVVTVIVTGAVMRLLCRLQDLRARNPPTPPVALVQASGARAPHSEISR